MKRVYLSGKMTGLPNFGVEIFAEAAARLRAKGFSVFSPAEAAEQTPDRPWEEYIKDDLQLMLKWCDGVVVLPNWEDSRGARLEVFVARACGLPVTTLFDALGGMNCEPPLLLLEHVDFLCNLVMTNPELLKKQPQPVEASNEKQPTFVNPKLSITGPMLIIDSGCGTYEAGSGASAKSCSQSIGSAQSP